MQSGRLAIGTTFSLQVVTSLAWMALPVLAPYVALSAGVAPSRIGEMAGVMFAAALVANILAAQLVTGLGALRTIQAGVFIAALGLFVAQLASWPLIIAGAVVIGAGYGLGVPGASHLLARHAAGSSRGLVFSIKQSGVPVGGWLAGMMLPTIAAATSWQWAVVSAAAICLLVALVCGLARSRLDDLPTAGWSHAWHSLRLRVPLLATLRAHDDLAWLTYSGFAAAAMQGSTFALLVAFLVATGRFDVVTAGFAFATMHVSGAAARIALGVASDRLLAPQPLLALLALIGAGAIMTLVVASPDLPEAATYVLAAVIGATVSGWNGVYLAEVAHLSPPGRVGETTASSVALVFLGYVIGPPLASVLIGATGSYALAFGALAVLLIGSPVLLVLRGLRRKELSRRRSAEAGSAKEMRGVEE